MKSFTMRPYYLAPLLVLAMIACAKRDSNFAKDAAAKRAAEQQKAGTQGTPTASPSPGASPADATPADAAPAADPDAKQADDAAKTDEEKKAEAAKKANPNAYEGDLTTEASCVNPISSSPEENENAIEVRNILTADEGTYILESGELFIEQQAAGSDKFMNQINAIATPWTLPAGQDKASGKNLQVICNSVDLSEKSTQKVTDTLTLPYDINSKSGFAKHIRRDEITLSATEKTVKSDIYLYKNADGFDLKAYMNNPNTANESVKTVVTMKRVKNTTGFKLIIKKQTTSATGVTTKTILGTYSLKK